MKDKQGSVQALQAVATLLALLAVILVSSGVGLYAYIDNNPPAISGGDPNLPAAAGPARNEQLAIDAGLSQNLSGEKLFVNNCTQCHAIGEVVVGPALAGVYDRRSTEWIHQFVKNSQVLIQSGDKTATALYKEYNQTQMPPFNFTTAQIDSIIAYIQYETVVQSL
jgi:mono/diheme cytochrome c family protein